MLRRSLVFLSAVVLAGCADNARSFVTTPPGSSEDPIQFTQRMVRSLDASYRIDGNVIERRPEQIMDATRLTGRVQLSYTDVPDVGKFYDRYCAEKGGKFTAKFCVRADGGVLFYADVQKVGSVADSVVKGRFFDLMGYEVIQPSAGSSQYLNQFQRTGQRPENPSAPSARVVLDRLGQGLRKTSLTRLGDACVDQVAVALNNTLVSIGDKSFRSRPPAYFRWTGLGGCFYNGHLEVQMGNGAPADCVDVTVIGQPLNALKNSYGETVGRTPTADEPLVTQVIHACRVGQAINDWDVIAR